MNDGTLSTLVGYASEGGPLALGDAGRDEESERRVADVLQVVAATPEFQRA